MLCVLEKNVHSSGFGWSILLGQISCSVVHIFCILLICCLVVVSIIEKAVSKFQTLGLFLLAEVLASCNLKHCF